MITLFCTAWQSGDLKCSPSKNHICTNSLGPVNHSYQSWEWWEPSWNPSSQLPTKDLYINSFLHSFPTHFMRLVLSYSHNQRQCVWGETPQNFSQEFWHKNLQQNIGDIESRNVEKELHHDQVGLIAGVEGQFKNRCSINVTYHIHRLKRKDLMILSIDGDEAFDKIQHSFMIKNSKQIRNRRVLSQLDKEQLIVFLWWKMECFPLR